MDNFERYSAGLKGKNILGLGLGVSIGPLVRLLLRHGCTVTGCDRTPREKLDPEVLELEKLGAELRVGDGYLTGLDADLVFRTPGMHPGNAAIRALEDKGAEITSEMEVFFELCPCTIIAVTGSDGKTTTTTLIGEMLKAQGCRVWIGGNIGAPLLPHCPNMKPEDFAVVELSSFQLMDMRRSPHIAVITNLAPNHLDVHKDMDEYIRAKCNIFRFQTENDKLVLNGDNPITAGFAPPVPTLRFSRQHPCEGMYLEGDTVYRCRGGKTQAVLTRQDILLPGLHNVENYMAAMLAVEGLVSDQTVKEVAGRFGGVEHRVELVRVKDGVRFYNDSIASSPSRTIAGLKCFPEKVILIAGGYDKHIPYDTLGPEIAEHVKKLYLTGATAPLIRAAAEKLPGCPPIVECGDFAQTVRLAAAGAEAGDVVLLSPASASFDCFRNFMERGNCFKKIVSEL